MPMTQRPGNNRACGGGIEALGQGGRKTGRDKYHYKGVFMGKDQKNAKVKR